MKFKLPRESSRRLPRKSFTIGLSAVVIKPREAAAVGPAGNAQGKAVHSCSQELEFVSPNLKGHQ